jgi:hypothetical protein
MQLIDACFRRVASDQCPIDSANQDAGDPVGMKISLGQCLIASRLISTERTTTLEDERNALERWTRRGLRNLIADRR